MSEKALNKINTEQFDSAVTRDINPWEDMTDDRQDVIRHAEGQELVLKRRGFGKKILDRVTRKAPEVASVYDNEFTRGLVELGRDGWGQVSAENMELARAARSRMEREETSSGRQENDRRHAIKDELAPKNPSREETGGW